MRSAGGLSRAATARSQQPSVSPCRSDLLLVEPVRLCYIFSSNWSPGQVKRKLQRKFPKFSSNKNCSNRLWVSTLACWKLVEKAFTLTSEASDWFGGVSNLTWKWYIQNTVLCASQHFFSVKASSAACSKTSKLFLAFSGSSKSWFFLEIDRS